MSSPNLLNLSVFCFYIAVNKKLPGCVSELVKGNIYIFFFSEASWYGGEWFGGDRNFPSCLFRHLQSW